MTYRCSVEDIVDAADGWHPFGTECPKEEIVFVPGRYLIHCNSGQHLQADCRARRLYPLDSFAEQLVGLSTRR